MKEMGWSWQELISTPFIVLEEIYWRTVFKNMYIEKKRESDEYVNSRNSN